MDIEGSHIKIPVIRGDVLVKRQGLKIAVSGQFYIQICF